MCEAAISNQRKIYFLREGFSYLRKMPRRDILAEANDWTAAADMEGMRHYPQVLVESGKTWCSRRSRRMPSLWWSWRYHGRTSILQCAQGGKVCTFVDGLGSESLPNRPLPKVGANGIVGRSTYAFLTKIVLSSRERTKAVTRKYEAVLSSWIWQMRDQKKYSEATARKPSLHRSPVSMIHRNDGANSLAER